MRKAPIFGIITLILFMLGAGAYWYARSQDQTRPKTSVVAPERPAAPFDLADAQGQRHSLKSLKGKVIVLHFWAKWCAPCLEEIPFWLAAAKSYEGKNVKWVAISLDQDWSDAHKILPSQGLPSSVLSLIDPEQAVPEKFGSFQFPETYLINSDLQIVEKWVGPQDWNNPAIRGRIDALLNGSAN